VTGKNLSRYIEKYLVHVHHLQTYTIDQLWAKNGFNKLFAPKSHRRSLRLGSGLGIVTADGGIQKA